MELILGGCGGNLQHQNFPAIGFNFLVRWNQWNRHDVLAMGLIAASEADAVPEPGTLTLTAAAVVFLLMLRAGRKVLN